MNSTVLPLCLFLSPSRLHNAFHPQDPSFALTLLHVLSAPLHGLANAFVFGLDRDWWSLLSPTGLQVQQTQAMSTKSFRYNLDQDNHFSSVSETTSDHTTYRTLVYFTLKSVGNPIKKIRLIDSFPIPSRGVFLFGFLRPVSHV